MICAIILSAGMSSRFGSPKALVSIDSEPVIIRLQKNLLDSGLDQVIVVLGAHNDQISPFIIEDEKVKAVFNKDFSCGQTSSFKAGVRAAQPNAAGYMLYPVDYPFIKPSTIIHLVDRFKSNANSIVIPTYNGSKGHPPLFPSVLREEILNLPHETGINCLARQHSEKTKIVPVEDKGIVATFNTVDELSDLLSEGFEST